MARPEVTRSDHNDPLDDLFTYDDTLDDVFNTKSVPDKNNLAVSSIDDTAKGLGIDEEVIVSKKRASIAKLDESRLLSERGIKKLRSDAKKRLRFRGKGHEFSDMQRLLSFYQLWLDDLYPRAKFADGLAMIEKLGHKSTVRVMRQAWIDEDKPRAGREDDYGEERRADQPMAEISSGDAASTNKSNDTQEGLASRDDSGAQEHTARRSDFHDRNLAAVDEPQDDELDALLAENPEPKGTVLGSLFGSGLHPISSLPKHNVPDDEFAEEMEAMAAAEAGW